MFRIDVLHGAPVLEPWTHDSNLDGFVIVNLADWMVQQKWFLSKREARERAKGGMRVRVCCRSETATFEAFEIRPTDWTKNFLFAAGDMIINPRNTRYLGFISLT